MNPYFAQSILPFQCLVHVHIKTSSYIIVKFSGGILAAIVGL